MTRQYEAVYIFDTTLDEAQINERLERFHAPLKTADAPDPVPAVSHWGKRTLAYPIKGRELGHYVVVQFETHPDALAECERLVKLDESVLRHLIVVNEGLSPAGVAGAPSGEGAGKSDGGDE